MNKKKDAPQISVIVPVYKVEKYLDQCVQSIFAQYYNNLEIILVDDGSPDNCPELCDEYAAIDDRVKVVHKENGGLASARNAGLDVASGKYIAFVDSDDWIEPQTYLSMMEFLIKEELDIVCCEISRVCDGKEIERYRFFETGTVLSGKDVTRDVLLDKIGSQVVKGLYHRDCWENIRFPVGMLYEDIPVTFLAFSKAERVGFIAEPYYLYRANDESISFLPKAIKPYHQFLGFKTHYDYSLKYYPEIVDQCRANAAMYAISTCFHYYTEKSEVLREPSVETERFLRENKKQIMSYKGFMKTRKLALRAFFFSKSMFRMVCRAFNKSGIQKITHFDMK